MTQKLVLLGMLLIATSYPAGTPAATDPIELRLQAGTFRPVDGTAAVPDWYAAVPVSRSPRGLRYVVAITRSSLGPDQRRELEAAGAEILDYLPRHGYRLRVAPEAEGTIRRLPFVAWLGELPGHFKVQPGLAARVAGPAGETAVRVILAAGEPESRVLQVLTGSSPLATPSGKDGAWRVTVAVRSENLPRILSSLAALPEVEAIEQVLPFRPFNQDAVWVHQSFVGPSPQETPVFDRGVLGCGQIVGVADTGQDYDLCYFRDTVNGPPPISSCGLAPCPAAAPAPNRRKDIVYYNWSGTPNGDDDTCPTLLGGSSGHGTHTSGSIAGDNSPYADCASFSSPNRNGGDGQAPGAKLVVQEMGDGLEYLNNRGGTLWNLADVAYQNGARIHSNSWGGACYDALGNCVPGCTMPYDSYARDADLAMWTYPDLLVVAAAGNAGISTCSPPIMVGTPAIAKSLLTVGSVGHGANANFPSGFTSSGPVMDGRLKPAVAAQGEAVVSAGSDANPSSNNCDSCPLDGSSMSAPTAAGLAALVREYYAAGYYATGSRNPAQGFTPTGALVKATLIDGAVALGPAAPGPDFNSGYGRILLGATLSFAGGPFQLRVDDHREGITTGSVVTHAYDVSGGSSFRATLVWSDYPAALNAAVARVNELKLEVTDPLGNTWFQTLNAGTGLPVRTSNLADPHDTRNVEERLVFNAPASGRWVVRVRGVDVPLGPQPFAVVVRGALTDCPAPPAPAQPTLTTPADHQVLVSWGAVSGATAYNVYRSFGACPGAPWMPVATGLAGTSYLDGSVSGGVTYSYYVVATSDSAAACESPRSPCASAVPTGDCFLSPVFRGVKTAQSAGQASCSVTLTWDPATPYCAGDVRYNIYRSTSSTFTPAPANRIARCVIGTTYTDSVNVGYGVTNHYIVRAEDASTGHAGPCRGGNEETNLTRAAAAADGPPVLGTWSDDAGDTGSAKFDLAAPWTNPSTGGNVAPKVYTAASFDGACADLTTPVLTLASPAQGPQLSFATKHNLEYDPIGQIFGSEGSLGQAEIATGPGFTNWTRVPLSPNYPEQVDFPFNDCPTTQAATRYFTGVHMSYTTYSASLANWAGGDVKIRFHLSGDHLNPTGSWWIDDASVTQAMVPGSCAMTPAGPPPVPDGAAVPGVPLKASKSGSNVLVTWDASQCPATAVNLYRGAIGNYTTFTAGHCNLPPTGSAVVAMSDNVWFLVAATDGASTDGSWGRTLTGAERSYAGASAACPAITQHVTNNGCP